MTKTNNLHDLIYVLEGKDPNWEPFLHGDEEIGKVSWLRQTQDENRVLFAGLWKHLPEMHPDGMPYGVEGNETFYVIEGKAELTDSNGNTILLVKGNSYSFKDGYVGTWKTLEPFTKFFIVSLK